MKEFKDYTGLLGCGVYALILRGKVVYVGKATSLVKRLYTHDHYKEIEFDCIKVFACKYHDLERLEAHYIHTLNPTLNQQRPMPWPERRVDLSKLGLTVRSGLRRKFR